MNKCDFCRHGPLGNNEYCCFRGDDSCEEAVERYMKVVMSRNQRTNTYNKNVNVRKNTTQNNKGKKR